MRLKEFLQKERYTSRHVAEYAGVSPVHIATIVRGEGFASKTLAEKIERFTKGNVKASTLTRKREKKICPTCKRPIPRKQKEFVAKIISVT